MLALGYSLWCFALSREGLGFTKLDPTREINLNVDIYTFYSGTSQKPSGDMTKRGQLTAIGGLGVSLFRPSKSFERRGLSEVN